ncbi:hypothetical protein TNCV_1937711 [Trichonephila clavipes]|nr:hypothetical protein TNCV_1937711 [Trichonephila clavipes]
MESKEGRKARVTLLQAQNEVYEEEEGLMYGSGLDRGDCGQHPCPPKNRRACKGPVQHEFNIDVSGDSCVQWSDETRQLFYVLATWEDYSTRSIGIFLSVLT